MTAITLIILENIPNMMIKMFLKMMKLLSSDQHIFRWNKQGKMKARIELPTAPATKFTI